jgi:hypothetical protein
MANLDNRNESIKLVATVIIALCNMIFLPVAGWAMLSIVDVKERVIALETWKGSGDRYTAQDASKDFGVIVERIMINSEGVKENRLAIKDHVQNNHD